MEMVNCYHQTEFYLFHRTAHDNDSCLEVFMEILRIQIGISKRAQSFKCVLIATGPNLLFSFTSINEFHVIASNHLQRPKELIDRSSNFQSQIIVNFQTSTGYSKHDVNKTRVGITAVYKTWEPTVVPLFFTSHQTSIGKSWAHTHAPAATAASPASNATHSCVPT